MQDELLIETEPKQRLTRLRLLDENGVQLGFNEVQLQETDQAMWEGVFDTRRYVDRYQDSLRPDAQLPPDTADDILQRLEVFLGQTVLGEAIFRHLTRSPLRRTLVIRLPKTTDDVLAAAFARIPWEIARLTPTSPTLLESALVVRMVTADIAAPDQTALEAAAKIAGGETLRVLLVFAEAPNSRPLAMRQEREQLLELFYRRILPKHPVQIDVLCHGVTQTVLREQIQRARGYHIVHWSGHGHHNLLELRSADGKSDFITGEALAQLFIDAGGFIPHLVVLSACLSGTFVNIVGWESLLAQIGDSATGEKPAATRELNDILENPAGYTGTALSLLRSGVLQVVAMRYEVGDDYAREFAGAFYQHLLADANLDSTESALTLARTNLAGDREKANRLGAVNHATPLIFGQPGAWLTPVKKRSEQLSQIRPKPEPLLAGDNRELEVPSHFVGRSEELTRLNIEWLGSESVGVALVQGLAGLGKTVIAAEVIHLWHHRFDWVFAFQAKPNPLTIDDFYRQLDLKLSLCSAVYREKCDASPYEKIYLEPQSNLTGDDRYRQMQANLIAALRDEATLIVLDNFETVLETHPREPGYACIEPAFDGLLGGLVNTLPETDSRLLLTSRHRPAVLSTESTCWIPLGPLPIGEADVFVRSHPKLSELRFGDEKARDLLRRLLEISRGHPLILDRLGAIADEHAALSAALNQLDTGGLSALPSIFSAHRSDAEREAEGRYLTDVATGSIDLLIERLGPDARRLLWVVTLASEPVTEQLIEGVWSGQSVEDEGLEQLRQLMQRPDQLPPELREELENMPDELREALQRPTPRGDAPPVRPLLDTLHSAGLLTKAGDATVYQFHELVRERIDAAMQEYPAEQGDWSAETVWVAYGERYLADFRRFGHSSEQTAQHAAREAGRRALHYMVKAGAFDRLGAFAGSIVTGTSDPTFLSPIIAELKAVVDTVPAGERRWSVQTYLADALRNAGQSDAALALYEAAAGAAEAGGAWSDVAWIIANWAAALVQVGELSDAAAMHRRSAGAHKKAGSPRVHIVGRELEAFRIDVMGGKAETVLPQIEKRLDAIRGWWERGARGESVLDAPDSAFLGQAMVSALDVVKEANQALRRWDACLALLEETEGVKRAQGASEHELAITRFNQYGPLMRLGRLDAAQTTIEGCLDVYRGVNDVQRQARALLALANVWSDRRNTSQAVALGRQALALTNRLPDPADRGMSHGNLAVYLHQVGETEAGACHHLATLICRLISGHHTELSRELGNIGVYMRHAVAAGETYTLPRLDALLAQPEFDPLRQFIAQRGILHDELQAQIDGQIERVRNEIASESRS